MSKYCEKFFQTPDVLTESFFLELILSHVHISLIKGAEEGEASSSDATMENQEMEGKTMDS